MVIVDSSIWIEAARRQGRLDCKVGLEGLVDAMEAMFCGPIKLEVLGGARSQDRARLSTYFESIPYRKMTDEAWAFAVNCGWRLRDKGQSIPWNDILIGSLAIMWNFRVYAADRHFEIMRDILGLNLYEPGYGGKFEPDRTL